MDNVAGTEFPVAEIMKLEAERLINYSTNFIAGTILCAIPVERRHQPLMETEKRYVGALWGMDMSRAILKLSSGVIRDYTEADILDAQRQHQENKSKLIGTASGEKS